MGKCKNCKCGDMIYGHDKIKDSGKQYDMYVCTNCDSVDYVNTNTNSKNNKK